MNKNIAFHVDLASKYAYILHSTFYYDKRYYVDIIPKNFNLLKGIYIWNLNIFLNDSFYFFWIYYLIKDSLFSFFLIILFTHDSSLKKIFYFGCQFKPGFTTLTITVLIKYIFFALSYPSATAICIVEL